MGRVWRGLAMAVVLALLLGAGAMAGDLDGQLWDEVGLGGDAVKVRALLDAGANANTTGLTGVPVLMFADNLEVVRALLDRGAEVNAQDAEGASVLYQNVFWGRKDIVELLLARGAKVNAKNSDGQTPLDLAAYKGWKEIAELLIARGAEVNSRDNGNKTPLHSAAYQGKIELVKLLIAKGAEVNAVTAEGLPVLGCTCVQDKEIVAMLQAAGAKGTPEECSEDALMYR